MTFDEVLLTLHILAAILLIGWLAMQAMILPALIRRGPSAVEALRFSATNSKKIGPLSSLVFVLGFVLVIRRDGIGFSDSWVSAAMALFIAAALIGMLGMGPTELKALQKFEQGQPAPEEAKRLSMLGGINALILVVITYLMVVKP